MTGKRSFDTDVVVELAAGVFRERGFAGASIQDLESATGLGRGSLYNAFGDKHGLFMACLDSQCAAQQERMRSILLESPSAIAGIRLMIRTIAVKACSAEGRCGPLAGNTAADPGQQDGPHMAVLEQNMEKKLGMLSETLERAQREGDFDPNRVPRVTARFIMASIQGMFVSAKTNIDPKEIRELAEEILRVLD